MEGRNGEKNPYPPRRGNRIRNNNKRSLKCSGFRSLYRAGTATVNVSRAVLVHSLGCGFQIKGYGRKKRGCRAGRKGVGPGGEGGGEGGRGR